MTIIKAFHGYLVNPRHATEVVSPAYDAVSPEERRKFANNNPQNFLNTMRLLEDFAEEDRPGPEELLQINRRNLDELLSNGSFDEVNEPCLFIYQLDSGSHLQTGVVCEVGVSEYEQRKLRKHENTRSDKEDLLARYQKVVGVSSSPICLTYPQKAEIKDYLDRVISTAPDLSFDSEDGVHQKVWCIKDVSEQQQLQELFADIDITYLTDGHHRAASGLRYAELMRQQFGNNGDEPYNQLLVALFSDQQLNLLPFHRCVRDLNDLTVTELTDALAQNFDVTSVSVAQCEPAQHGQFGMLVGGEWYRLTLKSGSVDMDDPVASLDVSILQDLILGPILGIGDMRSDIRLDYVSGVSGVDGLVEAQNNGWKVCFACYATSIDQLMQVADAGALMPPKSTYFDPKARSGVFVRKK
ncbi:MAG: DUF1015 family protein [Pseudomonadota bacterium]